MPTYTKAPESVSEMASKLIAEFPDHESLLTQEVKIDFMFAYPDYDEKSGEPVNDALRHHGVKALGIARKLSLKDRAKGLGDCEITLDGDWWERSASEEQQRALLDHELHHFVAIDKRDDLGRPKIFLRDHDYQFGWFSVIAARHGIHSQERIQAAAMMEIAGQFYWPEICAHGKASRIEKLEVRQTRK